MANPAPRTYFFYVPRKRKYLCDYGDQQPILDWTRNQNRQMDPYLIKAAQHGVFPNGIRIPPPPLWVGDRKANRKPWPFYAGTAPNSSQRCQGWFELRGIYCRLAAMAQQSFERSLASKVSAKVLGVKTAGLNEIDLSSLPPAISGICSSSVYAPIGDMSVGGRQCRSRTYPLRGSFR